MAKPEMFDTPELPADVQAKLARLAELEKQNAELLESNTTLKNKVETRGIQPFKAEAVELDDGMYRYTVDLPSSGGLCLTINGMAYYHGQTYTVHKDVLTTMMEMVHRSWGHEEVIHGSNENAYRPQLNATFSMRSGQRVR